MKLPETGHRNPGRAASSSVFLELGAPVGMGVMYWRMIGQINARPLRIRYYMTLNLPVNIIL